MTSIEIPFLFYPTSSTHTREEDPLIGIVITQTEAVIQQNNGSSVVKDVLKRPPGLEGVEGVDQQLKGHQCHRLV